MPNDAPTTEVGICEERGDVLGYFVPAHVSFITAEEAAVCEELAIPSREKQSLIPSKVVLA